MLGIVIGLVLLMVLAYRGYSIIWIAPLTALIVAAFGGIPLLEAYKVTYMEGFVGFTKSWFPVFMFGAIFGHLMDYTGSARSLAQWLTKIFGPKRAILGVVVSCAVLTYGGISLFVVVFAIYPLAVALFREANISRKLIPGSIALGSFTFTMTALPGTPQIQNLIPMEYYKTTPTAGPIMGLAATIFIFGLGMTYLQWREKKLTAKGDVFTEPTNITVKEEGNGTLPNPLLSFLPLLAVVLTLNLQAFGKIFKADFPNIDIIVALLFGVVLTMVLNFNKFKGFTTTISAGATGSITAIMNTSAAVGFGAVVKSVPGFQVLTNFVLGIKGSPLISEAFAVNLLAGATGSASGGMGIALAALGEKYYQIAMETGISPEAFHRVASLASGGLDTLPHNGAVLTLLAITGMTHKESYKDIFVTSLLLPVLSSIPAIIIASFGIY